MSRRSIRKIIAKARRNSFRGLKQQIRGMMWVDDITVDTHLAVFSDEYMRLFWSHLITGCTFLRRLGKDETCARPKDIIRKVSRQCTIGVYNGATKIHLKDSTFYIKEYGELLSCGPYSFGNAVLNIRADDAVGLMTAYDQEIRRCNEGGGRLWLTSQDDDSLILSITTDSDFESEIDLGCYDSLEAAGFIAQAFKAYRELYRGFRKVFINS